MSDLDNLRAEIAAIRSDIQDIRMNEIRNQAAVEGIKNNVVSIKEALSGLDSDKVSNASFAPIKNVYEIVSKVVVTVLAMGILVLVLKTQAS